MQILLTPGAIEVLMQHSKLKDSYEFNNIMFKHYRHLYIKHRKTWRFTRAAFAWFKMAHYQQRMYAADIKRTQQFLLSINAKPHERATRRAS